jgi:mercuric ion transport protein
MAVKGLVQQLASLFGTSFAAACCLGVSAALSVLTAIGAGFLIRDAFLIPLFLVFVAFSLWLLYRSARAHADLRPFWAGLGGGVGAFAGLWIAPIVVFGGLAICVAASLWDFRRGLALRAWKTPQGA